MGYGGVLQMQFIATTIYLINSGLVKNSVRKQFWIFQTAVSWTVIDGF